MLCWESKDGYAWWGLRVKVGGEKNVCLQICQSVMANLLDIHWSIVFTDLLSLRWMIAGCCIYWCLLVMCQCSSPLTEYVIWSWREQIGMLSVKLLNMNCKSTSSQTEGYGFVISIKFVHHYFLFLILYSFSVQFLFLREWTSFTCDSFFIEQIKMLFPHSW